MFGVLLALSAIAIDEPGAERVLACQYEDGAIGLTGQGAGDRIVSYFGNVACHALLAAYDSTNDKKYLKAAEEWLYWYVGKQQDDGDIFDHTVVKTDPLEIVATDKLDAQDSNASTFLNVLSRWSSRSGDIDRAKEFWPAVEKALMMLESLRQKNSLTFAKHDYKVFYLMDNTETYAGLSAASDMAALIGLHEKSKELRELADEALAAINEDLWDADAERYEWAMFENGKYAEPTGEFYPDTMAQLMAIIRLPRTPRTETLYRKIRDKSLASIRYEDRDQMVWWLAASRAMGDSSTTRRIEKAYKDAIKQAPDTFYSHHVGVAVLAGATRN